MNEGAEARLGWQDLGLKEKEEEEEDSFHSMDNKGR